MTAPTPLLLTKRLNAFLCANQSPQLPTLLLTTSQGKLLAHASSQPVAVLRTHATVAASLLSIHAAPDSEAHHQGHRALSPTANHDYEHEHGHGNDQQDADAAAHSNDEDGDDAPVPEPRQSRAPKPVTITVQLSHGTVIIRRLQCGLLFVCVGPLTHDPNADPQKPFEVTDVTATSASDGESLSSGQTSNSTDSTAAAIATMRKQASGLARWLDDKLGALKVPEETVGVE